MKKVSFIFVISLLVLFYLPSLAEDSGYGHIVGDRKYFGRNYIVKNPRATQPPPGGIPLAKMDSTQQECEVWGDDQRITFLEYTYHPRVAVHADSIHVVWYQHWEVFYKRSVDGGETWGESVALSVEDNVSSVVPDIAVEGGNVYVVWEDWTSLDSGGIYFR
ncbi:MAG: hypothetical protein ACE5NG_17315, partial [bacterium]